MDLIEQSSLNWNYELFDKVFIDFADMDIGEPIKNHKFIINISENIVLFITSCMAKLFNLNPPICHLKLSLVANIHSAHKHETHCWSVHYMCAVSAERKIASL